MVGGGGKHSSAMGQGREESVASGKSAPELEGGVQESEAHTRGFTSAEILRMPSTLHRSQVRRCSVKHRAFQLL